VRDLSRVTRREADQRHPSRSEPRVTVSTSPRDVTVPSPAAVRMELDVRGTRADDVLPRVERYLSDAYLTGMPFVRIIHGKGTGVLRQIIRDSLTANPMVQSYEPASSSDGGEGATIVRLAV
jgi:DNA mismatch repair protein MutS2